MDDKALLLERAKEKLEAAKDLLEDGHYSDAVSRAYYSMLFAARALLSTRGLYPKTHRGTISKLAEDFVASGKFDSAAFKGFALTQEEREKADYGLLSDLSKNDAEKAIASAEVFLEAVIKLL